MRTRIKTVDGSIHISDEIDMEASNLTEGQVREKIENVFENFSDLDYISLTIDDKSKFFNPSNVVWGEVID